MTNIKEKVLKRLREKYPKFAKTHPLLNVAGGRIIFQETIDLTLAEVGKVIDDSKLIMIKRFGISMAGKYRNQGMLEYAKELKEAFGIK